MFINYSKIVSIPKRLLPPTYLIPRLNPQFFIGLLDSYFKKNPVKKKIERDNHAYAA